MSGPSFSNPALPRATFVPKPLFLRERFESRKADIAGADIFMPVIVRIPEGFGIIGVDSDEISYADFLIHLVHKYFDVRRVIFDDSRLICVSRI